MDEFMIKKLKQTGTIQPADVTKSKVEKSLLNPHYYINIDKTVNGMNGGGIYNGLNVKGIEDMARVLESSLDKCGSNLFCDDPISYVGWNELEKAFENIENGGESKFTLTIVCEVTIGKD